MSSSDYLNKLVEQGHLKKENIGLDQTRALIAGAERNLTATKKNLAIDEETCFAMAYTAMLKISRAVIYLKGLRPDDGQQHKTTVEAAGFILGKDFESLIIDFDKMRRKRNQFTYNPLMPLSRDEAEKALKIAEQFINEVKNHLQKIDSQKKLF